MTRTDVEFPSGDDRCAAWLYRPEGASPDAAVPVVVLAHGLGGVREMRLDAYAERFTAAGYACLVFDYRHFGASGGEPRQLLDVDRQLADWAAAVRYARRLDGVDSARVVLWGSSFSGGHVVEAAARDGRIAAVVSQCPFTDGLASALATPPVTTLKIAPTVVRDVAASILRRPPVLVPLAAPHRGAALMASDDALEGYRALRPDGMAVAESVAARVALQISRYFPGRSAKKLTCPALFCVCDHDTVAPARATLRHVEKAPRGEVMLYPYGHFDIYLGEAFETVVADQVAFLRRVVPV
ncbi:alpha/beta hydrolase [Rhodococcoides corynebacterioides]|uniref:Alpha/beta fold hydrolase n=1 Tax=Rhodococcoides corynebacterioides TaxID=53972 RepID=A0ABS7NYT2_9NOCA|nr:alpha/beta fold hydrolase [Rhodococcus corynebacterioides]MBY6365284.1 alpha/beta fold hydrolase [Rhodococcus corynebacterioides]MBY6406696.1 alpha/beta fold hydrolase [Rhodococcus corynebacterioides]